MVENSAYNRYKEWQPAPDLREMGGVDILVVLGKNIGIGSAKRDIQKNPRHLSMESKFAVRAAAQLARQKLVKRAILFSGGHTAGEYTPSEAQAMFDYYFDHAPVKGPPVILEEKSIDTSTNAKEVGRKLTNFMMRGDLGLNFDSTIGVLTIGYHLERSLKYFDSYNIRVAWWGASEDLLSGESPRHAGLRSRFVGSTIYRREQAEEDKRLFVQTFDPKGWIPQAVLRFTRR